MENKTAELRREILKGIVERYGHKDKKFVVRKAKESGVYKNFVSDEEVYELVKSFAEFHKLPFGYTEEIPTGNETEPVRIERAEDIVIDNEFLNILKSEHSKLSKKLLHLTKLISSYEDV